MFRSDRVCANCGGRFTADRDTKIRQALFIIVAIVSLIFTLLLYYESNDWLFPAMVSYLALTGLIWWGNRKVRFVPYRQHENMNND
ncbi:MAG: hypothetical protein C0615_05035 [Desulfuromonas sp.]|nr:MAG: hypothetical protein C0615_05035 [Desulfuromonas sp.]